jgi:hypothetical protein
MFQIKRKPATFATFCTALTIALASPTFAVPVDADYIDDARCDPVAAIHLSHELGDLAVGWPIDEAIFVDVMPTNKLICVGDDGVANDWEIRMTNMSGIAYRDLFFVADLGVPVGNADGVMFNGAVATDPPTDAFRIDGTVTVTGGNDNLLGESGALDEIFSPGESWTFLVSNFEFGAPPSFTSIGLFGAGSAPFPSNASILATPVPEPVTLTLVGPLALAALRRRRRKGTSA